jgi:hypothetical protein
MARVFFSAPHPLFGRKDARLSLTYQQRSPYYWWWAYLRRSTAYLACCERNGTGDLHELYEDFGDVRSDDFRKWWSEDNRGAKLFGEMPLEIKFRELMTVDEWDTDWTREQVLIVAVPLAVSKRKLKSEFAQLLDSRHTARKSGRSSLAEVKKTSTAKYRLERNYTIAALSTTLSVYDLWVENQKKSIADRLTLWQIGKALNLNKRAIQDAESKTAADRLVGRNLLGATVGRYVKHAKSMIDNAERGRFPLL